MVEAVSVRIEGNASSATAAARETSAAYSEAAAMMKAKLTEASSSVRNALGEIGAAATKASSATEAASNAIAASSAKLNREMLDSISNANNLAVARARGDTVAVRAAENEIALARSYDQYIKAGHAAADAADLARKHLERLVVAQKEGERQTNKLGGAFQGLKGYITGAIAALSVGMFVDMGREALEYASSIAEVAQQLGTTTAGLQEYRYIATQVGISQNQMDEGFARLTKSLGAAEQGNKKIVGTFKELSTVLGREVAPAGVTTDVVLRNLVEAFSKIEDPAKRAALEVAIFGKSGQKLDTLLAGGVSQVDNLRDAAHKLGIVLSEEQIAKADETADKLASVQTVLKANIAGAVANNAGAILQLANSLSTLVVWAGKAASAMHSFYLENKIAVAQQAVDYNESVANGWRSVFATTEQRKEAMRRRTAELEKISEMRGRQVSDVENVRGKPMSPKDVPWAQATAASIDARGKPSQGAGGGIGEVPTSVSGGKTKRSKGESGPSVTDIWRTDLEDALAAEKNWGVEENAFTLKFWQEKLATHRANAKETLQIEREVSKLKLALHKEDQAQQLEVIRTLAQREQDNAQTEIELAREVLQAKMDIVDDEEQRGIVSASKAIQQRMALNRQLRQLDADMERQGYEADLKSLTQQRALYRTESKEYQTYTRQIETLEQQHQNRVRLIKLKAKNADDVDEKKRLAEQRARFSGMADSYGQAIARMVTLQQGFGTTIKDIWNNLLGNFTNMLARMISQWILSLVLKEAASKTFNAKEILMNAKAAAAGAYKAVVGIPIVGPALAPIAAAAAFVGVLAFSAKDGYDVPGSIGPGIDGRGGQVGIVHPREMVLPADLADKIRNGGGGGGDTIIFKTLDARSFRQWARSNKGEFVDTAKAAYRDGKR